MDGRKTGMALVACLVIGVLMGWMVHSAKQSKSHRQGPKIGMEARLISEFLMVTVAICIVSPVFRGRMHPLFAADLLLGLIGYASAVKHGLSGTEHLLGDAKTIVQATYQLLAQLAA